MFIKIHNSVIKGVYPLRRLNSLSQNLTVLTAPSGREPLAHPQALHFSRKLYHYAKGPISEDDFPRPGEDVTAGDKRGNLASRSDDWGSSGKYPFRLAASRQATFPKGTALAVARKFPA